MGKRIKRTSLEVVYSILSACNEGNTKTKVMYAAGINLIELEKYLELLEKEGYIKSQQSGKSNIYLLTDKGKDALTKLEKYVKALKNLEEARKDVEDLSKLIKRKKGVKTSTSKSKSRAL